MSSISLAVFNSLMIPQGLPSHMIHSTFSFLSKGILFNKKRFSQGSRTHLVMALVENIAHRQSGGEFSEAYTFPQGANAVHGQPGGLLSNHILLNIDCVGLLQNCLIVSLHDNKQVTSRVMVNNFTVILLFLYDHQ